MFYLLTPFYWIRGDVECSLIFCSFLQLFVGWLPTRAWFAQSGTLQVVPRPMYLRAVATPVPESKSNPIQINLPEDIFSHLQRVSFFIFTNPWLVGCQPSSLVRSEPTSGQFVHNRKLGFSQAELTYLRRSGEILRYESSTPTFQELSSSTFFQYIFRPYTDPVPSRSRGAFFAWRAPILSWPRIMCSQMHILKCLELLREMP